jgi:ecotin
MKQIVIRPARLANESNYRIEFYAGQTRTIDCNSVRLSAGLIRRDLAGWGYPYWEMPMPAPAVSTLIGCPPKSERQAFVHGPPEFVPYRSALPIVVYVPTGYAVRYKLWRTEGGEKEVR